jgi:periplasmic divalent cation tolerance protein
MKNNFLIIFSTVPSLKVAEKIGATLVKEKLAACANITGKIRSIYSWKGKICREGEVLMILKTRKNLYGRLEKRLRALHPYELPEVIALPLVDGSPDYLQWLAKNTR